MLVVAHQKRQNKTGYFTAYSMSASFTKISPFVTNLCSEIRDNYLFFIMSGLYAINIEYNENIICFKKA